MQIKLKIISGKGPNESHEFGTFKALKQFLDERLDPTFQYPKTKKKNKFLKWVRSFYDVRVIG